MIICKPSTVSLVSSLLSRACLLQHKPCSSSYLYRRLSSSSQEQTQQTTTGTNREFKHAALSDRAVFRVSGSEASEYLQGIISNDIGLLLGNDLKARRCMYTFVLNTTGRIVADMFVYSIHGGTEDFLLEVDNKLGDAMGELLKRYKIRRKLSILRLENCRVTAIYPDSPETMVNQPVLNDKSETQLVVQDPRSHYFGYRILSLDSSDPLVKLTPESEHFNGATFKLSYANDYRRFRYRLGIGEGVQDFPYETVFPFEANAELLNAVSFSKGCYVGQELTARTYHTGVIRKRLLPIELLVDNATDLADTLPMQNVVVANVTDDEDAPRKIMGRFKVNFGRCGLATLKHAEMFTGDSKVYDKLKLEKSGHQLRTWRPFWWPEDILQKYNQQF